MRQDAVKYCFLIIGEAVKQLDAELMESQPHIPWRLYARFRDLLIHQYHKTDTMIAWRAAQEDLPGLKVAIIDMIERLDNSETGV